MVCGFAAEVEKWEVGSLGSEWEGNDEREAKKKRGTMRRRRRRRKLGLVDCAVHEN